MNAHPKPLRTALHITAGAAGLLLTALAAPAGAQYATPAATDSVKTRLILRTFTDFGHIVNGTNLTANADAGIDPELSMQPLNRTNFLAIQEVAAGNFDVAAGLSGLIWWPYGGGITDGRERVMNVKPMIPVARVRWRFGDAAAKEGVAGALLVGTFSHKYNPDAKNLGEYLYRSGTYPGFLFTTEGWLLMNRASNYSHGALLSLTQLGGALRHNLSLFMETNYYPVGDFSPGYDVSYTQKWFELGGGAVLNHYLALRPSTLEPKRSENTYVHLTVDTGAGQTIHYYGPENRMPAQFLDPSAPGYSREVLHHWSHKGVKVMGRAALNLNSLLPADRRSPEDGRIFAEVAVLGWENQPLYYEKRDERMPVMFGVNVPTFKLLDVLTLQGEYYASPFNNMSDFSSSSLPVWASAFEQTDPTDPSTTRLDASGKVITVSHHEDDWKWSVYGKKAVNKVMTVYAQAARDHLRLTDGTFAASGVPLTSKSGEWYYLVRLEFTLR